MEKMVASCGLVCSDCDAFIATKTDNQELRIKTAENWSKMFDADFKAEQIYCDGCTQIEGHLFSHCKVCEIRLCCIEKGIENCAFCDDYVCDKLEKFFKFLPSFAKENLDAIRTNQS